MSDNELRLVGETEDLPDGKVRGIVYMDFNGPNAQNVAESFINMILDLVVQDARLKGIDVLDKPSKDVLH